MKKLFLFLCLCIAAGARAQEWSSDEVKVYGTSACRVAATLLVPEDALGRLTFSWEREVRRSFNFVLTAGLSQARTGLGDDSSPYGYTFNGYGSAEVRFYPNLKRRIRNNRNAAHFSAEYIALEQYFISNPLFTINEEKSDEYGGHTGTYLNVGLQRHFGKAYFNVFFGPRLWGRASRGNGGSLPDYQGGISVGIVW